MKQRYRDRVAEPAATKLVNAIQTWTKAHQDAIQAAYDKLEPFDIENDRLAELLLPLQAVLTVIRDEQAIEELRAYADDVEAHAKASIQEPDELRLLRACREVFNGTPFMRTPDLIAKLCQRQEEPWASYLHGEPITPHKLGHMLSGYGIKSGHSKDKTQRGYERRAFSDAWTRYVPESASDPSVSSQASGRVQS